MSIRWKCSCGQTLESPDGTEGRTGRCPNCGNRIVVPGTPRPKQQPMPVPRAPSPFERRARAAAGLTLEEKRVANDQAYCTARVSEFAEIITVAKESCRAAGRPECQVDLDRILVMGTLLLVAWGKLRPMLESSAPAALFAYAVMVTACWTSPQCAIRFFTLGERKQGDTEQVLVGLISTTASTLQQLMAKLGLG